MFFHLLYTIACSTTVGATIWTLHGIVAGAL